MWQVLKLISPAATNTCTDCKVSYFRLHKIISVFLKGIIYIKLFTTQSRLLTLKKKPFENIVGKGENAGNQDFLLFPRCCLLFQPNFICHLQNALKLYQFKNLSFNKELSAF